MKISNKQLYTFLIGVAIIKIICSFFVELGNDESYYYTYALKPQLNYFDHPPMVGILIRLSTFNLSFVNDALLRLGPTICCIVSSVFIFKIGRLLYNDAVGWYAMLLYNFSIYTSIIAGWFIMPDSPQMPFWCGALYMMCRIIFDNKDKKIWLWILLGAFIGFAALSKVHALYLWGGFGLFILFYRTKWLLNWSVYIGFIVTLICLLPILIWNINNKFITYTFHAARVTNKEIHFDSLLREIIGEALYQNPVVFVLIIVALINLQLKGKTQKLETNPNPFKKGDEKPLTTHHSPLAFLLLLSLPMILLFWYISLKNDIFPHWSGPAYIPLFIIAGVYLSKKKNVLYPIWIKIAGTLVFIAFAGITVLANFAPFNIGSQNKENFGEYCPTLDISGWKDFSKAFDKVVKHDFATNKMKPNSSIIINQWFPGCQLELYTSRKTGLPIYAIGSLENIHHFAWLNQERKAVKLGDDAYCIVPSNNPLDVEKNYNSYFTTIEKPDTLNQIRSNTMVRYFCVWRLKNCKKEPEDVLQKAILTK